MPTITPYLWFDHQAQEAMDFYTSIFPDSRIGHVERYPDESLDPHFAGMSGKVISGSFDLWGTQFQCLDGGPQFPQSPAISFYCSFDDQATIQQAWRRLCEDGKVMMELQAYPWAPLYGWVADRFGVTWQLSLEQGPRPARRITPLLMFTGPAGGHAQEAMSAYTALFTGSGIDSVARYEAGEGDTPGLVKHARFHLGENHFMAMESTVDHGYTFSECTSLFVSCQDQAEIDRYWNALIADGGSPGQCGWCKDRYGVSWQIIPANLGELLGAGPAAVQAMMAMGKMNIAELQAAGRAN